MEGTYTAPDRFAVSHLGMRELHADRPPWHLVKELIQNAWDEAPNATRCDVAIKPLRHEAATLVTVSDDGPGFRDITDAWTLMKHTDKRHEPTKRGRFNMGEKEIISVALEAEVQTVGHTVSFPRMGSRTVETNQRTAGTVIKAVMPWDGQQAEELIQKLGTFRPTECRLTVNGTEVPIREPLLVHSTVLNTVLQDGPGEPMRPTRRRTNIHILEPIEPDQGWLYEMGIPVQPITTPWDVDVMQKIPMPPNRDTVSEAYLSDVYAEVLNATHQIMEPRQFGDQWVKQAIEDDRSDSQAVVATVSGRYGDKVLLTSSDADANMKAAESDYQLINPRSLSRKERERFREEAGLQTTHQMFGQPEPPIQHRKAAAADETAFASWVQETAALCGLSATVRFMDDPNSRRLADCTADTTMPTVRFNAAILPPSFFQAPYARSEQLQLVIHELAHALANKPMEHGPAWGEAAATIGAILASRYHREND